MSQPFFASARPVWGRGRDKEMNLHLGLRALFEAPADGTVCLSCATSCSYRVWLNGHYVGYGPARTGRGHFRVDVWPVREYAELGSAITECLSDLDTRRATCLGNADPIMRLSGWANNAPEWSALYED